MKCHFVDAGGHLHKTTLDILAFSCCNSLDMAACAVFVALSEVQQNQNCRSVSSGTATSAAGQSKDLNRKPTTQWEHLLPCPPLLSGDLDCGTFCTLPCPRKPRGRGVQQTPLHLFQNMSTICS